MTRPVILPMEVEQAEAIAREQRIADTRVVAEGDRVTFPRARNDESEVYFQEYRHDCRRFMRAWVAQRLRDFDDVFGVSPATHSDALTITRGDGSGEIGRALYVPEQRLLAQCVRDIVIVWTAMRAAAELRAIAALMPGQSLSPRTAAEWADNVVRVVEDRAAMEDESANTQGAE